MIPAPTTTRWKTTRRTTSRAPVAASRVLLLLGSLAAGCGDAEPRGTEAAPGSGAWLTDVTDDLGIRIAHESGARGDRQMPEVMGPGVALFDADGDGDLDLYAIAGGWRGAPPPAAGTEPKPATTMNRLLLQEEDGRFRDATERSGLGDAGYGMGVAVGDVDRDGRLDVYVTNDGPDRLYRNRGDGVFEDATVAVGIAVEGWSCSAAFVDYDRDGWLDLFVTRYVAFEPDQRCQDTAGRPDYCGPRVFPPLADVLLRNDGDGTFTDVSAPAGIGAVAAAGLGVVCEDFDDDGWVDVYVANDGYANHLWLNQGDGTFRETATLRGAACNLHGQPEAGMGVVADDLDGDGRVDLFVTHLSLETNTLYRNLGGTAGFVDTTGASGLGSSSMAFTGFGVAALDLELDGDLDLLVANGRVFRANAHRGATMGLPWSEYAEPNLCYLNDGGGRFTLAGEPAAAFTAPVEVSRGLATGDLDGDGDPDVVVSNTQGRLRVYRHDAPAGSHWLAVRPVDDVHGLPVVGTRVTVHADGRTWARTVVRASSYLSSSEAVAHFGLGGAEGVDGIHVRWPDGREERFDGGSVNRVLTVVRGRGAAP